MLINRNKSLLVTIGIFMLAGTPLVACSPMQAVTSSTSADAMPAKDAFAAEVSAMAAGASACIPSPIASNTVVKVGEFYTSALGQKCRSVTVNAAGATHRLSVCQGENGWYTVDSIFEAMPH